MFHMTDDEIARNRQNREGTMKEQVALLADLNAVSKRAVCEKLTELGFEDVPTMPGPKPKRRNETERAAIEATEELRAAAEEAAKEIVPVQPMEGIDLPPVMTVGGLINILSAVSDSAKVTVGGMAVHTVTINARYGGDGKALEAFVELE